MVQEQERLSSPSSEGTLPRIGVVGVGAVGTTLAWSLAARGYPVVALCGSASSAPPFWLATQVPGCLAVASAAEVAELAELVLLTVPDDALSTVVASIPWHAGQAAVHCSGATPARVLAYAGEQGSLYGSFHPLLSIPRSRPAGAAEALARLAGCTFAIEAPVSLAVVLEEMAHRLGAHALFLKEKDRVPYHLAAVLTSNYLVSLLAVATDLWAQFGVAREEAQAALLPLLRSTLANLEQLGLPESLTGPIARGDLGTVRAHLTYLAGQEAAPSSESALDARSLDVAYRALGLLSLPVARAKGRLDEEQAAALYRLLSGGVSS
jgi:predicted short-subunit dehydrogenase-like oxidoreductase (DUF2520 family)